MDGELPEQVRGRVELHVSTCDSCRHEVSRLDLLAAARSAAVDVTAPAGLWAAVEQRLDGGVHAPQRAASTRVVGRRFMRFAARPLAAAAVLVLAIGVGWVVTSAPWAAEARAAQIDFRPLLEQADGDVEAGFQALMRAYGGKAISVQEAAEHVRVRVHAPPQLAPGLHLRERYLLNMGRSHQALAFHYTGPDERHLLLLQCPPEIEKDYGNFECLACSVGAHDGHGVQVGKLRLMHMASENVCVCVVSTLDERELAAALDAVEIDF